MDNIGQLMNGVSLHYYTVSGWDGSKGSALNFENNDYYWTLGKCLVTSVWGRDYDGELKIVDVNIRRLRIKIENDTANPTFITTVWGFGYKWGA